MSPGASADAQSIVEAQFMGRMKEEVRREDEEQQKKKYVEGK